MIDNTFNLVDIQMNKKGLEKMVEFDPSLLNVEVVGDKQRLS